MRRPATAHELMLGLEELTRRDVCFTAGDEITERSSGITVPSDELGEQEET